MFNLPMIREINHFNGVIKHENMDFHWVTNPLEAMNILASQSLSLSSSRVAFLCYLPIVSLIQVQDYKDDQVQVMIEGTGSARVVTLVRCTHVRLVSVFSVFPYLFLSWQGGNLGHRKWSEWSPTALLEPVISNLWEVSMELEGEKCY